MSISTRNIKKLQNKYGIKPCSVILNKMEFSKIRIGCIITSSEKKEKISWNLKQEGINNFSIKIKRKLIDIADICEDINPQKRIKSSENQIISPAYKRKGTLLRVANV